MASFVGRPTASEAGRRRFVHPRIPSSRPRRTRAGRSPGRVLSAGRRNRGGTTKLWSSIPRIPSSRPRRTRAPGHPGSEFLSANRRIRPGRDDEAWSSRPRIQIVALTSPPPLALPGVPGQAGSPAAGGGRVPPGRDLEAHLRWPGGVGGVLGPRRRVVGPPRAGVADDGGERSRRRPGPLRLAVAVGARSETSRLSLQCTRSIRPVSLRTSSTRVCCVTAGVGVADVSGETDGSNCSVVGSRPRPGRYGRGSGSSLSRRRRCSR